MKTVGALTSGGPKHPPSGCSGLRVALDAVAKAVPVEAQLLLCKVADCGHMKTLPAWSIKMIMGQFSALS